MEFPALGGDGRGQDNCRAAAVTEDGGLGGRPIAPARRIRSATKLSTLGTKSLKIGEPRVVRMPSTGCSSLTTSESRCRCALDALHETNHGSPAARRPETGVARMRCFLTRSEPSPRFSRRRCGKHVEVALPDGRRSPRFGRLPRSSGGLDHAAWTGLAYLASLDCGRAGSLGRRNPPCAADRLAGRRLLSRRCRGYG